jgi:hypothetical protein
MEPKSGSISRHDHARIHARMAKTETPSELSNADASRVALDGRALNYPGKAGLRPGVPPADLFDAGTGGFGSKPSHDAQRARSLAGSPGFAGQGAGALAGPGPVRARDRRSVDELPFVDEEDVIEEEALGQEHEDDRFGAQRESDYGVGRDDYGVGRAEYGARRAEQPNGRRAELAARQLEHGVRRPGAAAKLPIANLEPPSGPRLDLTPSPVPRVALAPATGSVDISLVPGPHDHLGGGHMGGGHMGGGQSWGSRNLPTLAAQHLLGGRQRRPAPAVTLPPPGELPRQQVRPASRDRRLRSGIAKDVRSSKREIVLGLMIGLGLSMLLAGIGQAYLAEEQPIADAQRPELESLTLSARPEVSPPSPVLSAGDGASSALPPGEGRPVAPTIEGDIGSPVAHAPVASAVASRASASMVSLGGSDASGGLPLASRPARAPAGTNAAVPRSHLASPLPARVTPERARRSGTATARSHAVPPRRAARSASAANAEGTPSFEAGKSFESPANGRPPLSPAESAGLGLDLPL